MSGSSHVGLCWQTASMTIDEKLGRPAAESTLSGQDFLKPDPVLQKPAGMSHGAGLLLTLYLPWGAVTEVLVDASEYFQRVSTQVQNDSPRDGSDTARASDLFGGFFSRWADDTAKCERRDDTSTYDLRRAHLKNAACVGPSGTITPHDYLRIRLSEVSAWSKGAPKSPERQMVGGARSKPRPHR